MDTFRAQGQASLCQHDVGPNPRRKFIGDESAAIKQGGRSDEETEAMLWKASRL